MTKDRGLRIRAVFGALLLLFLFVELGHGAAPIRRRRIGAGVVFVPPQWVNLQLWLSADTGTFSDTSLSTAVTTDGSAVGGWRDRSPLGNNGTQATAGKRPVLKTAGINGHPSLLFTAASTQYLSANGVAPAFTGSNMPATVIAVVQLTSTPTQIFLGFGRSTTATPTWFFYSNTVPLWAINQHDDTTHSTTVSGGTPDTNPHIVQWMQTGTTGQIWVDGVSVVGPSAQNVAPITVDRCAVGALDSNGAQSFFLNGNIGDMLAWNVALSTGEAASVRAALAKKYGISSS